MNPTHQTARRTRAHRIMGAALAGGLVLVAAACSGDSDAAETTLPEPTAPETTEAPETTTKRTTTVPETTAAATTLPPTTPPAPPTTEAVIPRMPLTGQPLEAGQVPPDRPALVVKIDNNPRARPQSGLNEADLVFEEVVEAGTRFAVVFHSGNSNPVGPIRSGRTQDIDLLGGLNQPLFAWSGGNANVERAIANSDFIDLNPKSHGGLYRRQGSNGKPHNFYSDTDKLFAAAGPEATGRPVPLFGYLAPGVVPTGAPGGRAEVRMDSDTVIWEFDPVSGALRAHDERPGPQRRAHRPARQLDERGDPRDAVPAELRRSPTARRRSRPAVAGRGCSAAVSCARARGCAARAPRASACSTPTVRRSRCCRVGHGSSSPIPPTASRRSADRTVSRATANQR